MIRPAVLLAALALAGCSKRAPAAPAAPIATPTATAAVGPLRIGMNLAPLSYFATEGAFLDRARLMEWGVPAANKDATGFPNSLPAGMAELHVSTAVEAGQKYLLLYDGSPVVSVYATERERAGHNVIGWNGTMSGLQLNRGKVAFKAEASSINWSIAGFDPAAPIRNVRIVRADQAALLASGQVFTPEWLDKIGRRFSPLRMMDWGCTNNSALAHWADRPHVTDATWNCAPAEIMIAAANAADADLWLTLPAHADDDYVRRLATLVRDTLSPKLRLHLEYSNEVWNDSFEQSKWAQAQGVAAFGPVGWERERFYGRRAAQVMALARPILGERLIGVLATWDWRNDEVDNAIADGVARARLGPLPALFGEYAFAPYFGDGLGVTIGNDADRPTTLRWARDGAAGVDAAFAYLEHGTGLQGNSSLDYVRANFPRHAAWARAHGLAMTAYEGGLSVFNFAAPGGEQGVRVEFLKRVANDPRMGRLYALMLHDFAAAGGTIFAHYNDVGAISIFGAWGVIPDLAGSSPRYEALRAASPR